MHLTLQAPSNKLLKKNPSTQVLDGEETCRCRCRCTSRPRAGALAAAPRAQAPGLGALPPASQRSASTTGCSERLLRITPVTSFPQHSRPFLWSLFPYFLPCSVGGPQALCSRQQTRGKSEPGHCEQPLVAEERLP